MLNIRRALEAKKAARENGEEAGFSLIELIIVVVIIGILVAIAIPLFGFIQKTAVDGATQSDTKNAATTAVAEIASGSAPTVAIGGNTTLTETGSTASTVCVSGYNANGLNYTSAGTAYFSGPGAKTDHTGCN